VAKVYTRKGDDGTTMLWGGGRVSKNSALPRAYGAVDEAQAFVGVARAEAQPGSELDDILVRIARDMWLIMTELATNHDRALSGARVTDASVEELERIIDGVSARFQPPKDFAVPGQGRLPAALDVARATVRRAERESVDAVREDSSILRYLNRLSDLLWMMARWQESSTVLAKG
jgi:cob(I)alamin adenosyltransferase